MTGTGTAQPPLSEYAHHAHLAGAEIDVRAISTRIRSAVALRGEIEHEVSGESARVVARATRRLAEAQRQIEGYYTAQVTSSPAHVVRRALDMGRYFPPSEPLVPAKPWSDLLERVSAPPPPSDVMNVLRSLSDSPDGVVELRWEDRGDAVELALDDGRRHKYTTRTYLLAIGVTVRSGGVAGWSSQTLLSRDPEWLLKEATRAIDTSLHRATLLREASPLSLRSRVPVLLDAPVAARLLGLAAQSFQHDAVLDGRSTLAARLGRMVASPGVQIIDDVLDDWAPRWAPLDDEGTPTQRTVLVEDGHLATFLSDRRTASRSGGESTGSGWGTESSPAPACRPAHIALRTREAVEGIEKNLPSGCLWVLEAHGVHTANPISGEFAIGVLGQITGGSQADASVRGTIAGNVFEMLQHVEAAGHTPSVRFAGASGGYASAPALLVNGLTVSG